MSGSKMTNRRRISSSTNSNRLRRHHQRSSQEEDAYDDDLTNFSHSESPYYDEDLEPLDDDDHYSSFALDSEPEAALVSNPFSSQTPGTSVSENSINFNRKTMPSSFSAWSHPNENLSQITSYVKIAPFPIFHGRPDECPDTHLSRFVKVCRANNVSTAETMMKIFAVTLESEAALWYDMNIEPYYSSLTWEKTKCSFLEAYDTIRVTNDQLRSELMMIEQGDKEPVRSYFLRLQWILKRWPQHGLSENLIKGIFIDGLREEFHDWIVPQKPSGLNEALRLAFGFEQVKSIRGDRKVVKCGFCDGLHEERECKVRERMRELWLKSKEENRKSGGMVTEFARSVSMVTNNVVEMDEEGEFEGLKKKNQRQCQCGKHQCWKKSLIGNYGVNVTENS